MHPQEYKGYLKGNCLKYLWRYEYKNGIEDLKKAQVYLGWLSRRFSRESRGGKFGKQEKSDDIKTSEFLATFTAKAVVRGTRQENESCSNYVRRW